MFFVSTLGRSDDITIAEGAEFGMKSLVGFGLGCSIIYMFVRIRGSIFAKSSNLGDLEIGYLHTSKSPYLQDLAIQRLC